MRMLSNKRALGWKLPKFYLLKTNDEPEEIEVVDGQQRLTTIFDFFDNIHPLSAKSAKEFWGSYYFELPAVTSDAFGDFEIEYDEITDANERELKEFFQQLQQGLPLTSSEELNAVHSNLRNFCKKLAEHDFFKTCVVFSNKRYAFFDVTAKAVAIEIEGLNAGLRFDELKELFESQENFSSRSEVAKRVQSTLEFLKKSFQGRNAALRNRSIVQSVLTLAAQIVSAGRSAGYENEFGKFVEKFVSELVKQVELGVKATDLDYITFQKSVNANVRGAARTRNEIMLRKLFHTMPALAQTFDPAVIASAGPGETIERLASSVTELITKLIESFSKTSGHDLFKVTNKTIASHRLLAKQIRSHSDYTEFVDSCYFLFWEGPGQRLGDKTPSSFADINEVRVDLRHDVDHGKAGKVAAKRKKISRAVSERIESVGGFPNRLISASSFTLREWGRRGLSNDLRERVVEAVVLGGLSRNQAAAHFKVSIASAVRWVKRFQTTGEISPAPSGGDRRSGRIEAHRDYLLGLIRRSPDMTLLEIQERLIANCGERFAVSVLWRFFDRHEITFKKNSACRGTTTRGRAKSTPGMVRGAARSRSDETRFR